MLVAADSCFGFAGPHQHGKTNNQDQVALNGNDFIAQLVKQRNSLKKAMNTNIVPLELSN